jgi:serine protease Do
MKKIIIILLLLSLSLSMVGCLVPISQISAPPSPETETPSNNAPPKPIAPAWSPSPAVNETPPLPSIADVVEKVYPSVVTIATEITTVDFFNMPQTQSGAGSGWIIDKNGIIVTNNHVVEGAKKVTVALADGRTFQVDPANVYRDPSTDMAIIKIDAKDLPAASLGDSTKLRVGDWVVAIGNPLGLGLRAKQGIVSGLKVSLSVEQGQPLDDLIETSAAINPGNSGGPLANMSGQVIGITSAKISAVGVEGLGYAISIKTALPIIEQLITNGYVIRPYLGVQLYTVDQYVATINHLPVDKGVAITYVAPGSPADKAGLKAYDIITQFKDKEVTTDYELLQVLHSCQVGEEVKITIVRGKETKVVYALLTQSPPPSR